VAEHPEALAIGRREHAPRDLHKAEQLYRQAVGGEPDEGGALARTPFPSKPPFGKARSSVGERQGGFPQQALRIKCAGADAQNKLGIMLAEQGRLDEAAARFQQALDLRPDYPDSHNNLGIVLEKQDQLDAAIARYQHAILLKLNYPEAHYNLGIVLARQGRLDEAMASYQQAIRLKPDYPDAYNNLGTMLAPQGRLDEAIASYQQALHLKPAYPEAHNNLGLALARQGRLDEAVASYQQALRFNPNYPEAHSNLGNALQEQGRLAEAVASCQQAVLLKPDSPDAHHNLGIVLAKQEQLDAAVVSFQQVIRLRPDYPDAHNNLGIVLGKQDQLDAAVASFQQALHLKPDYPEAHHNLGLALARQGRLDEALPCYQQALDLKPDYPEAHWDRGLACLLMGRFEQGWAGYEWRWKCKEFKPLPPLERPLWDGSPLDGRTILVHAEQGLGDTFQFIRYAPLVQQRGGRVVLVCQPTLIPLLRRGPVVERLLAQGDALPEYDVHVPLISLPKLLGTTLESVPADVPYLEAEPQLVEAWRHRLAFYPGFKVGIAWQGNPEFRFDHLRSIPLAQFAPLARVPGVHLLSLQKGAGRDQLPVLPARFPVTDLGGQLDETTGAFLDTAAVMMNLDLVITSDTAVAHLAGALGVPVWVALHHVPDWRWLLDREDCPWYPTMRLFRQTRPGQWEDVFEHIAEALQRRLAAPNKLWPIAVEIAPGELIDKITILEIKSERIGDAGQRHHVDTELAALVTARGRAVPRTVELAPLTTELKGVNEALWQIENEIRRCERDADFGPRFIALARSVYRTNDRRAALKRQINELLDSRLIEAKSYTSYDEL
jgi:tetratricopeptide (TPR) repeat protein